MFGFNKKDEQCPVCKMTVTKNAIKKYGEKFCSDGCLKKYEEQNQIAGSDCCSERRGGGCCH